jgi:hypothetical protein
MAYFAKLNSNNIVETVISINNAVITDANGVEQEQLGIDFINQLYNTNDTWKQTSYNNNIRKNYAGIGYIYDVNRDAFIPPKPFNSWVLNEDTCNWKAPIPYPITNTQNRFNELGDPINDLYSWNESTLSWDLVTK